MCTARSTHVSKLIVIAASDAVILGVSRQIALDVVQALPERASLEDILVAVTTWH